MKPLTLPILEEGLAINGDWKRKDSRRCLKLSVAKRGDKEKKMPMT
jgi:hypothetical protein